MSDCYCDYDPPEWITVREVNAARKRHKCEECRTWILEGESYEDTCGKWDGYVSRFKICERCVALRKWALEGVKCFCWAYGSLHDDVLEMVNEYRGKVPGLYFEYGRQMVKIRQMRRERIKQYGLQ